MQTTPAVQPLSSHCPAQPWAACTDKNPPPDIDPLDLESLLNDDLSSIWDELSSPCLDTSVIAPQVTVPAPELPVQAPQLAAAQQFISTPQLAPQVIAPRFIAPAPQLPVQAPQLAAAQQFISTPQLAPQVITPRFTAPAPELPVQAPQLAAQQPQLASPALASPEKALVKIDGRNTDSLRKLAIILARGCVFGDDVLVQSSPSGRGRTTSLSTEKMVEIRRIVRQRARALSEAAFEEVWENCIKSIKKTCQYLHSGRLKKNSVKL